MDKQSFKLSDKESELPFEVPEGFFENFEASLSSRIDSLEAEKTTVRPVVPLYEKIRPYLYFAAMFVLMFFSVKGILALRNDHQAEEALSRLDTEEVNTDQVTAEDILMSELDSYNIMYYLYGEEDIAE